MARPAASRCPPQPTPDRLFLTRALTATALLAGLCGALLWLDRGEFAALVAAVVALGAYEWGRLAGLSRVRLFLYSAACALLYGAILYCTLGNPVLWAAALFWIVAAPWWLAAGVTAHRPGALLAAGVAALVPAGLAMAALPPRYLLLTLGLVWISDTAAYVVGSAIGRHKLAPSISPGKSWEGVGGAVVGGLIYAIICAALEPVLQSRVQGAVWVPYLGGAMLLCAVSIVGDLFESALKRQAGAKDSGKLLPGHGGVLDRIDSATATLPVALLLMQAIGAT
ncbi:MAG TPA: phosphatidate cytidylyltransferase [Burkholderiales bacterium]|nr:phosphatidate cytidylyltransferase [Burkholderiales bacterium]